MTISLIVAADRNGVIGKDGKIPWFVRGEQAIFKQITMGHPVIMGRRTHESLPKTLPGRLNVVLSRNPKCQLKDGSILVDSLEKALSLDKLKIAKEVFIIGGGQLFEQALPLADKIYLTRIDTAIDNGDSFFKFDPRLWRMADSKRYEKNDVPDRPYDFDFQTWLRK